MLKRKGNYLYRLLFVQVCSLLLFVSVLLRSVFGKKNKKEYIYINNSLHVQEDNV